MTPLRSLQMEKDSISAEQYLYQSLQYLRDPQECVQDGTIRFTTEPHPEVPLWAAPVPPSPRPVPHPGSWWSLVAGSMLGSSKG